jgi:hypothetical protein
MTEREYAIRQMRKRVLINAINQIDTPGSTGQPAPPQFMLRDGSLVIGIPDPDAISVVRRYLDGEKA